MLYFKRIKEIESFITDHEMIKENDKVLIAFSGGPDSVFLFHALNSIKETLNEPKVIERFSSTSFNPKFFNSSVVITLYF